ncbi:MAG: homoserine O-acetyltransferase MetX [Lewinella sp.]|uniref:homoserine O-acetyltransferase MetX n=1 Tax=Lewinella sp. TaxID=2004506 RepID=UPI003D6A0906
MRYLHFDQPFTLESGEQLPRITMAYQTFGTLHPAKDNVVWVCHALTGNTNPVEWWPGLVGKGETIDPDRHFIVCANILGSCYGSTGPDDWRPDTTTPYGLDFPRITTRDLAKAHELLAIHLEIDQIQLGIGGSLGGQQLVEWAVLFPHRFRHLCLLATNARHSPWGIAFNEAQRMAMQADASFGDGTKEGGRKGLATARAIAMLSYRHYQTYDNSQAETDDNKTDNFRASSYQQYQGEKFWRRFSPQSYWVLSKAMDAHNVGRGRGNIAKALESVTAKTLVIGIDSDLLFPVTEQSELAEHIPDARFEVINSDFGHDGFLTETKAISNLLYDFMQGALTGRTASPRLRKNVAFKQNLVLPGSESF